MIEAEYPVAVLTAIQAAWNRAMETWDADATAELYDDEAQLFGSLPRLFIGRDGAREYYASFPTAQSCRAIFDNLVVATCGENLILASGLVTFDLRVADERRVADLRFSFVLRRSDAWRILVHHASPIPATSPAD